jgi:hypothetical protein
MKKFLLFLAIFFALKGTSQNINQITESDIPGILVTRNDIYEGEDLNDYLSGAADLYIEYGFRKLFVNEYKLDKDKATLEVYLMGDPPSAFGIYSLSVSRCMKRNLLGTFSCTTPYQVAATSGNLFIYASNPSGSKTGQAFSEQLVKLIMDKNPREVWYAPPLAQSAKTAPFINSLRYFKGPLAIRKGLPYWARLFEDLTFDMYTINITLKDFTAILARITFPDESTLSSFIMKAGLTSMSANGSPVLTNNGLYRSWYKISSTKIIFLESNSITANIKDFIPEAPDIKW